MNPNALYYSTVASNTQPHNLNAYSTHTHCDMLQDRSLVSAVEVMLTRQKVQFNARKNCQTNSMMPSCRRAKQAEYCQSFGLQP